MAVACIDPWVEYNSRNGWNHCFGWKRTSKTLWFSRHIYRTVKRTMAYSHSAAAGANRFEARHLRFVIAACPRSEDNAWNFLLWPWEVDSDFKCALCCTWYSVVASFVYGFVSDCFGAHHLRFVIAACPRSEDNTWNFLFWPWEVDSDFNCALCCTWYSLVASFAYGFASLAMVFLNKAVLLQYTHSMTLLALQVPLFSSPLFCTYRTWDIIRSLRYFCHIVIKVRLTRDGFSLASLSTSQ